MLIILHLVKISILMIQNFILKLKIKITLRMIPQRHHHQMKRTKIHHNYLHHKITIALNNPKYFCI